MKNYQNLFFLLLFSCVTSFCFCAKKDYEHLAQHQGVAHVPWFTGSLLTPSPVNMLPGQPALEPAFIFINTYGKYESNWKLKNDSNMVSLKSLVDFQVGLTKRIGLEIIASSITNKKKGAISTHIEDTILRFGVQVADDIQGSWIPDIRIDIQEILPTGSYHKLNPKKIGTDITGQGSFQTGPLLVVQKMLFPGTSFFILKYSLGYFFPSTVSLKGFNAYGGNSNTRGKVHPGQSIYSSLSGDYSFTQRWALGFDLIFTHQKKSTFKGDPESIDKDFTAKVGLPSSTQFSFTPFFEYSFSPKSGLLGGPWITFFGRNSTAFLGGFISFLYIF